MSAKCGKLRTALPIASQHSKKHLRRLMVTYRVHRREPLQNRRGGLRTAHSVRSHDGSVMYSGLKVETKQDNDYIPTTIYCNSLQLIQRQCTT